VSEAQGGEEILLVRFREGKYAVPCQETGGYSGNMALPSNAGLHHAEKTGSAWAILGRLSGRLGA
jgi:hypothetical protein